MQDLQVQSIPGLERSLGGVHGNPLQYSCLGNPTDRGAWWATVHGLAKSWTQLKRPRRHAQRTKKVKRSFHEVCDCLS